MSTAIWAGLGFLCFAVAGGTFWVVYQLVLAWKQVRRLPAGSLEQIGTVTRGLTDVERRVANLERQLGDLQRQVDGLSVSLARVRVLTGAVREVRGAVAAARSFLPSK
jgi:hypothetical protein